MRIARRLYAAAMVVGLAFSASTLAEEGSPGTARIMPNFRFLDVAGNTHELIDFSDAKAVVIFFHINGCPIVRQSYPYFEEIKESYADRGVAFLYVNSNKWDTNEAIDAERADYKFTPPVLRDSHRALAHFLSVERSADTFVVDPNNDWHIVYHGMADDRFDYGLQRMSPKKFWLRDALDAVLSGTEPAHAETVAKGCLLDMDVYQGVQFNKHVKPILNKKLAPLFSGEVTDEAAARGLSDALITVLLTQRNPEGHGVTLTDDEAEILVAWLYGESAQQTD